MNRIVSRACLSLSLSLAMVACGVGDDAEDIAGEETSAMDDGLTAEAVGALQGADPGAAATAFAGAGDPEGCRTKVLDDSDTNVVHVFLNQCHGRFGRKGHHILNGELLFTFSDNGDGTLHVDKQTVTLTIDGRDAERTGSADISFDGNLRHIDGHSETATTTEDGDAVSRVADHQIDIDKSTHCAELNGVATLERGDKHVDITLTGLVSCENPAGGRFCPTGLIEADVANKGVHITRTFDGSDTLTVDVAGPQGSHSKTVELDCTPQGN